VKLAVRYTRQGIPVEVELEGSSLESSRACEMLRCTVTRVDAAINEVMLKREGENRNVHSGKGVGVDLEQAQPESGPMRAFSSNEPTPPENDGLPTRLRKGDPQPRASATIIPPDHAGRGRLRISSERPPHHVRREEASQHEWL